MLNLIEKVFKGFKGATIVYFIWKFFQDESLMYVIYGQYALKFTYRVAGHFSNYEPHYLSIRFLILLLKDHLWYASNDHSVRRVVTHQQNMDPESKDGHKFRSQCIDQGVHSKRQWWNQFIKEMATPLVNSQHCEFLIRSKGVQAVPSGYDQRPSPHETISSTEQNRVYSLQWIGTKRHNISLTTLPLQLQESGSPWLENLICFHVKISQDVYIYHLRIKLCTKILVSSKKIASTCKTREITCKVNVWQSLCGWTSCVQV